MIIRQTTKDLLAASIMDLAKSKSVEKITIKDITQNCQLTSTTFYKHFSDKYQLLAWIYNQKVEKLIANSESELDWKKVLTACCTPLQENRSFYKNALKNTYGQLSFRYQTNDYAIERWLEYIQKRQGWQKIPPDVEFYFRFYMRALSETIGDWFLTGENLSVEELVARIDLAMPEPLKPYLKG